MSVSDVRSSNQQPPPSSRSDAVPSPFTDDEDHEHDEESTIENDDNASRASSQFLTPLPPPLIHRQQQQQPNMQSSSLQRQQQQQQQQQQSSRVVIFQRDDKGYGLTVSGESPVFVQTVRVGGAAEKAGVAVNDMIIKVNGHLVTKCNHHDVVAHIRSGTFVALTLVRMMMPTTTPMNDDDPQQNRSSSSSSMQQLYPHHTTGRQSSNHHHQHTVNNDTYLLHRDDVCDSAGQQHFLRHSNTNMQQPSSSIHASRRRIDSTNSANSVGPSQIIPTNNNNKKSNRINAVKLLRSDEEPEFVHAERQRYVEQTRIDTLKRMRERETQYLSTLEFRQLSKTTPTTAVVPAVNVENETYASNNSNDQYVDTSSSSAMLMAAEDITSEIAAIKRRVNELDEHIKRECFNTTSTASASSNELLPLANALLRPHHPNYNVAHSRQHSSPDIYASSNAKLATNNYGYDSNATLNHQNRLSDAQYNVHYADESDQHHQNNNQQNYCSADFAAQVMRNQKSHYHMHALPPPHQHQQTRMQHQSNFFTSMQHAKKTPSLLALPEMVENSGVSDSLRRVSSPGAFHLVPGSSFGLGLPPPHSVVPLVGRHLSKSGAASVISSASSDSLNTLVPPPSITGGTRRLGSFGHVVDRFFTPQPPPPLPPPNNNNFSSAPALTKPLSNVALLFSNYDEMCKQSAFLATFIHYLNSTSDSSPVLFDLLCSEYYRLTTASKIPKDLRRKWAFEIHSTFLMPDAPLELVYAFDAATRAELVDAVDLAFCAECENGHQSCNNKSQHSHSKTQQNCGRNQQSFSNYDKSQPHLLRKVLKDARDRVRRTCIDALLAQFVANCEWGMDTSIAGMPSESELSAALNSAEKSRTIMEDTIGWDLITVTIAGGACEPHVFRDMRQAALGSLFATFLKLKGVKINTPRIDCGASGNLVDKWPLFLTKQQSSNLLSSMQPASSSNLSPKDAVAATTTTHWWSSSMPQSASVALTPATNSAANAAVSAQNRSKIQKSKSKDSMHSQHLLAQQQDSGSSGSGSVGNRLLLLSGAAGKPFSALQQQNHQHNLKAVICSAAAPNCMIKHCAVCGMRLWGVAPQGLQCAQCDLCLHRSCLAERNGAVAEPCIAAGAAGGSGPSTTNSSPGNAAVFGSAASGAAAANLSKSSSGISIKPASSFIKRIKKRRSAGSGVSASAAAAAASDAANVTATTVSANSVVESKKVIAKHHEYGSGKKMEELHENVVRSRSPQLKISSAVAASKMSAGATSVTSEQNDAELNEKVENVELGTLAAAAKVNEISNSFQNKKLLSVENFATTHNNDDLKDLPPRHKTSTSSGGGGLIPRSESMKARHYTTPTTTDSGADATSNNSPNKRSVVLPKLKRKSDPAQVNNLQMQLPRSRSDLISSNGVLLRSGSTVTASTYAVDRSTTESSSLNSHSQSRLTPLSSATSNASISATGSYIHAPAAYSSTISDNLISMTTTKSMTAASNNDAGSAVFDAAAADYDDDSEPDAAGALSTSSNIIQHLIVDDERPWTQRIDAAVLSKMTREEQQRQEICSELLATERRHVRTLKTLVHIFRDPLRQAQLMPPATLELVFGHVDELIIIHMRVKQMLKQCLKPMTSTEPSEKSQNAGDQIEPDSGISSIAIESSNNKGSSLSPLATNSSSGATLGPTQTSSPRQNSESGQNTPGQGSSPGQSVDLSPASASAATTAAATNHASPNTTSSAGAELFGSVGFALQQAFGVVGPNGKQLERAAAAYCSERSEARKVLMRARKAPGEAGTKLNAFLQNASSSPWCRRFELQDMLACEMQRLTRYPLLLERLLKYSASDEKVDGEGEKSSEKYRIQSAIESCRRINTIVNTVTQERENYYRLVEFDARLDKSALTDLTPVNEGLKRYVPFSLCAEHRRLLFDGPLVWRLNEKRELILYVMLFSDVLVLLTPTGQPPAASGGGGSVSGGTAKDALSLLSGVSGSGSGAGHEKTANNFAPNSIFAPPFAAASMQLSRNSTTTNKPLINSAHSFDGLGTSSSGGVGNFQNLPSFASQQQNFLARSYQLKFHERLFGSSDAKQTYLPIMELDRLLVKDVATDARAFFLITATAAPQMYEMLADSPQDRQRWTARINDAIVASAAAMANNMPRLPRNRISHFYEQVPDDGNEETEQKRSKSKQNTPSGRAAGLKPKKSNSSGGTSASVVSTITKSVSLVVENSFEPSKKTSPSRSNSKKTILSSASFSSTRSTASVSTVHSSAASSREASAGSGTLTNGERGRTSSEKSSGKDENDDSCFVPELPARNFVRRLSDLTDHHQNYNNSRGITSAVTMPNFDAAAKTSTDSFSTLLSRSTSTGTNKPVANSASSVPPPLPPRDKLLLLIKQQHLQESEDKHEVLPASPRYVRRQDRVREYDEPADAAAAAAAVVVDEAAEKSTPNNNNNENSASPSSFDDEGCFDQKLRVESAAKKKTNRKRLSVSISCPVAIEIEETGDANEEEDEGLLLDQQQQQRESITPASSSTINGDFVADSDVIIDNDISTIETFSTSPLFMPTDDAGKGDFFIRPFSSAGDTAATSSAAAIELSDLLYRQAVQLQLQQQQRLLFSAAAGFDSGDAVLSPSATSSIHLSQYIQHAAKADAMRRVVRQLVMENEMLRKKQQRSSNEKEKLLQQHQVAISVEAASPEEEEVATFADAVNKINSKSSSLDDADQPSQLLDDFVAADAVADSSQEIDRTSVEDVEKLDAETWPSLSETASAIAADDVKIHDAVDSSAVNTTNKNENVNDEATEIVSDVIPVAAEGNRTDAADENKVKAFNMREISTAADDEAVSTAKLENPSDINSDTNNNDADVAVSDV